MQIYIYNKCRKIFINTGSISFIPPIKGINENNGAELIDLDTFPENLIIIGGVYIGLEFASMYSRFGSKVTVI